jgi:hypothetical protein
MKSIKIHRLRARKGTVKGRLGAYNNTGSANTKKNPKKPQANRRATFRSSYLFLLSGFTASDSHPLT